MTDLAPVSIVDGYITLPVVVDPDALVQAALATIASTLPGWVPYEGMIEVLLLEQFAAMVAEAAQVAALVPLLIFQYYGSGLVLIPPENGAPATAETTWTMIDDAGYTVPAGTVVAYMLLGNVQILFQTVDTFTVPASSTTATNVAIQALVVGSANNGLNSSLTLSPVTQLAYVDSIVTTSTSSGGADPESLNSYLNRLSTELQLLTPRPILPPDFAALASNVPGVYRAVAINGLQPGRVIAGTITLNGTTTLEDTAGSFTLNDAGKVVSGTDIFSGSSIDGYTDAEHVTLTHVATGSLTDGTVTLEDLTNQQRVVTVAAVDINGDALDSDVESALAAYLDAMREANFVVNVIGPTYSLIDVTFAAVALPGQSTSAVNAAAEAALETFLSQANWGTQLAVVVGTITDGETTISDVALPGGTPAAGVAVGQPISGLGIPSGTTITAIDGNTLTISNSATVDGTVYLSVSLLGTWDPSATVVRYLQLVGIVNAVPGVAYVSSLTFAIDGNSLATTNITLPGDAPMTQAGTISGSVIAGV